MQFSISNKALRDALGVVKGFTAKRYGSLGVLEGIRITAYADTVELATTNLDITARTSLPANVTQSGTVVVNHRLVAAAAKGKGESRWTASDTDNVEVRAGAVTQRLQTLPIEEWPRMTASEEFNAGTWTLPIATVAAVAAAAGTDDARPILTGVLFTGTELVATDSYRLHVEALPGGEQTAAPLLIPARALAAVIKATKAQGEVTVRLRRGDPDYVELTTGVHSFVVRLIPGEFPNYQYIIPKSQPCSALVDRAEFIAALDEAAKLTSEHTCPVRLSFSTTDVLVERIYMDGTVSTTVAITPDYPLGTEGVHIAFTVKYLRGCLTTLEGDTARLNWLDPLKAVLVSSPDSPNSTRLLMPVRMG